MSGQRLHAVCPDNSGDRNNRRGLTRQGAGPPIAVVEHHVAGDEVDVQAEQGTPPERAQA